MRKIVFFDIDGTLWDETNTIPESTKDALVKLRENGHLAVLCSGRSRGNIRSPKLMDLGFDGVIASCGNHVEYHGQMIHERILSPEELQRTLKTCKECKFPLVLEGPKKLWLDEEGFEGDPYVDYLLEELGEDAIFLHGYTPDIYVNKFSSLILPETDFDRVQEELGDFLDFIIHGVVVEAVPKNTSKATGIEILCQHLGIAKEDTFAIGDSINDLDMLQFVGHGISMGNGSQVAKDAAEYVTTDLHNNGVYNALSHYGLI